MRKNRNAKRKKWNKKYKNYSQSLTVHILSLPLILYKAEKQPKDKDSRYCLYIDAVTGIRIFPFRVGLYSSPGGKMITHIERQHWDLKEVPFKDICYETSPVHMFSPIAVIDRCANVHDCGGDCDYYNTFPIRPNGDNQNLGEIILQYGSEENYKQAILKQYREGLLYYEQLRKEHPIPDPYLEYLRIIQNEQPKYNPQEVEHLKNQGASLRKILDNK